MTDDIGRVTMDGLVELVAGHALLASERSRTESIGPPRVVVEHATTNRLADVSLTVRGGEICGVIGRAGCGRSALGRMLYGLERVVSGSVILDGAAVSRFSPRAAMDVGVAYVPQDRLGAGLLPMGSVRENATLVDLGDVSTWGFMSRARERARATWLVERYDVRPSDIEMLMTQLSGGNQQKVLVSRWTGSPRSILILDEPTEGVDAGARAIIYDLIRDARGTGAAVLLLTSSIEEALELCDRVLLMSNGTVVREFAGEALSAHAIEQALLMGESETERAA
jgi:ABC-type sugar transport system ATPase subunit